jgi:hypothetical protein
VVTKTAAPVGGGIPNPTWRDRLFHWNRARRRSKSLKKRQAPVIQSNTGSSPPPARRKRRPVRRPQGHTYRHRRPRRGALAGIMGAAVASVILTCAVVELVSWTAAEVILVGAEGVTMLTAYAFGEPSDRAKLKKAQQAGQPPKSPRQPAQPQRPAGHRCGAPTQGGRGKPCERPVKSASDHCWEHPGGKSTAQVPQSMGPRKTRAKGVTPTP